jgi:hypothetical protein
MTSQGTASGGFTRAIRTRTVSWVPVVVCILLMGVWYGWVAQRVYRDRVKLLMFLEEVQVFVHEPAWCLGLEDGPIPYDPRLATVVGRRTVDADVRPLVLPAAGRQARPLWALRNAATFYLSTDGASTSPHPFSGRLGTD